jgi:hypothetical protein
MFLPKNFNSVENGHDQFLKKKKSYINAQVAYLKIGPKG